MAGGNNVEEEFVATDGRLLTAPAATPNIDPESTSDAIDAAYYDHGLVDAAGITRSTSAQATPRYAWQNNTRLRTLVSTAEVRIKGSLKQSSEGNIELYFGTSLVAGQLVVDPSREFPALQVIYDQYDGDVTHREYFPSMSVDPASIGDQVAIAGDGIMYPVELVSTYDETIGGHSLLMFSEFEES